MKFQEMIEQLQPGDKLRRKIWGGMHCWINVNEKSKFDFKNSLTESDKIADDWLIFNRYERG